MSDIRAFNAARDILHVPPGNYISEQREKIVEIIERYFPVPRCDECKYWDKDLGTRGVCVYARQQDTKMHAELYDLVFTECDFGCTEYEHA